MDVGTTDPGQALITGKCNDVGSIVVQQLRGLSARAPYFANGSASSRRDVVDYYDRRFNMQMNKAENRSLFTFSESFARGRLKA
jgi:cytochrome c peroxidase